MRKRLVDSMVLSATMMMMLSLIPIVLVRAVAGPEIYLDPAANDFGTNTTSPCYEWSITIWIRNLTTPVYAWQVLLQIQGVPLDWINMTEAWNEEGDPAYIFYGKQTANCMAVLRDFQGDGYYEEALLGNTLIGLQPPTSGFGPFKLGTVVFHLTRAPGKYESFHVDLVTDDVDTYLLDGTLNRITLLNRYGGYVDYDWSPPTTIPTLAVEDDFKCPKGYTFDQSTNWTDPAYSDFEVEIFIEDLEAGWVLHNASFSLHYNTTLFAVVAVVVDPAWAGPNSAGVVPGTISIFVQGHSVPAGNVLVATVKFRILYQETTPPPKPPIETQLTLSDIILWDTVGTINYYFINGCIKIEPYHVPSLPCLEIAPYETVLGPELVICEQYGQTFEVDITLRNLDPRWRLIAINFRLAYDPEILEVVSVTEGPFLQGFAPDGTFPIVVYLEPPNPFCPWWHMTLADIILANATGHYNPPFPEGEGTFFTIKFKPLQQSWTDTIITILNINPMWPCGGYAIDPEGNEIPFEEPPLMPPPHITILPIEPSGRLIDVWFVDPLNGGQGIHTPADLVLPQTEIALTAKVTYNWWPVQYKKVTFEVCDCNGDLWAVLQDDTGDDGHAYTTFRMPWPCEGAEGLLGKWNVTVSVTLADVVITDYVVFDYDYLTRIWSVTTDKPEYRHCKDVEVTVEYGTHSMREENVTLVVTITDELNVPIALVLVELTVGGAELCQYKNYTTTVILHVDKFAYAGLATAHASFLNALPSEGGEAVAQEVTTTFWILPC